MIVEDGAPEPEKPECCQCCQFETEALTHYTQRPPFAFSYWWCDLCAGSMASTMQRYPSYEHEARAVAGVVCYVGNTILAALKKGAP